MAITVLLSKETAPLTTLRLMRVQLTRANAAQYLLIRRETAIYALVGTVRCHLDGVDYGLIGGRRHIRDLPVQAIRCHPSTVSDCLLTLESLSADLLITDVPAIQETIADIRPPFVHRDDALCHAVGAGTHAREVRELPMPPGYTIHLGETLNVPGGWSSWPDHSTIDERGRYAEHQETFYVVTPGYGVMILDGTYADGSEDVDAVKIVRNDSAFVTPLGSHPIVASPDAWLWYAWSYTSFLRKQYNQYAHHGVKQYIK